MEHDLLVKICFVGEVCSGKTCLVHRSHSKEFNKYTKTTIGVDFSHTYVEFEGKTVKLQIWDIASTEWFRKIERAYYYGATGVVWCIDLTNPKALEKADIWIREINSCAPDAFKIIVGCKTDLNKTVIDKQKIKDITAKNNMEYYETSAKNGDGVDDLFATITQKAFDAHKSKK